VKYRLYIDEVGNPDMGASDDPNHRYLSLTGIILELGYVDDTAHPRVEALKREFFGSHVDEPVILHRKELVNRKPPFEALRNPAIEQRFNTALLDLLKDLDYTVLTAVIDKLEHRERYQAWRYDPYHYCLHVILERYVMWLRRRGHRGDVMAESRGATEDRRLKSSFERLCQLGTDHMDSRKFAETLTSRQLKVKPKANNITGLQLSDLIAHPSFKAALARQAQQPPPDNFGGRIAQILFGEKYDRGPGGRIEGWGIKWLP
jgi:hypothetical protein